MKDPVGRVYVLTNPRMQGLVKIGFTLGSVEGRAKELDATGTPEPFEIAYQVEIRGPETLERRIHSQLSGCRVRNSREFFEIDVIEAILCVRNLAVERIDEECNPKFIELIDESARRRAEEREKQKAAEKAHRFEEWDREANALQEKRQRLKYELGQLQANSKNAPLLLKLTWAEERGELLLFPLGLVFVLFCIVGLTTKDFLLSFVMAALTAVIFISLRRIRSSARQKESHNLSILKQEREIYNLNFDLQNLERQKLHLPSDLNEFLVSNPIRADERGFESAARVDSRRRA